LALKNYLSIYVFHYKNRNHITDQGERYSDVVYILLYDFSHLNTNLSCPVHLKTKIEAGVHAFALFEPLVKAQLRILPYISLETIII